MMPILSTLSKLNMQAEAQSVQDLLQNSHGLGHSPQIAHQAQGWIEQVRRHKGDIFHHFLTRYPLNSPEGLALMSLAESLLRIPDGQTASRLIHEKMQLNPVLARLGVPFARKGLQWMGKQFVMGEDISRAIKRAAGQPSYRYSYDMLGESALTQLDAQKYYEAYYNALSAVGINAPTRIIEAPSISVKLSALHPRYQYSKIDRLEKELLPKIIELCALAKQYQIGLTIDAEEADRLQLSLILIKQVLASSELKGWDGFGLAVQAYQKAAPAVIDVCEDFARQTKHRIMLRLVKGAYWDSEIKRAQEQAFAQYPVYTRKVTTDVSYLVCAKKLLNNPAFYPQFATHNAYTIAAILEMAGQDREFEFQRLHGMGDRLYPIVMQEQNVACRVYAPVGHYKHLLAYLVRRLLENGANSSFVHQIENKKIPASDLAVDPIASLAALQIKPNPNIPIPPDLYGDTRKNSVAFDLSDGVTREAVLSQLQLYFCAASAPALKTSDITHATVEDVRDALDTAQQAFPAWMRSPVSVRAGYLRKAADLMTEHQIELMSLLILEGKKSILDAQGEVREAIDYCRYYAQSAEKLMAEPEILRGPTGERNTLSVQGRGIAVCISPWNFPLAIFLGQVVGALVTGNTVITKPAAQTPRIAQRAVEILHQAGIPKNVLQLLIGKASIVGDTLTQDPRTALVVFTGSLSTAQHINRKLAGRDSAIAAFIAETGGQNAMIVDSSALLEQVVMDVVTSAFNSAGQRCSALRVLCVQEEIFEPCMQMLRGAMAELSVGSTQLLETDVGPVIDAAAQAELESHIEKMKKTARLIYQVSLSDAVKKSDTFVAPTAFEIDNINILEKEVFGPVLHVLRYQRKNLPELLEALNATGYGLTLGIHSRIEGFAQEVVDKTLVGNNYVNRNMIGAVVGVQPFGGQRLSGTGPKAGGPHYLSHFVTEKTLTINTSAIGGNVDLLGLD